MSGALSWGLDRRRFDGGGPVAAEEPNNQPLLTGLRTLAEPALVPAAPGGALSTTLPAGEPTMPRAGMAMPPPRAGALAAGGFGVPPGQDPNAAQKLDWMQNAINNLRSLRTNGVDFPTLIAAGQMLKPTRTGGFAESLGDAMTAGGQAAMQQQQIQAQEQMRLAQLADTAAYREGMLNVRGQHEDTYAANQQSLAQYRQGLEQLKARGLSDAAARARMQFEARMYGIDTRAGTAADALVARQQQWEFANRLATDKQAQNAWYQGRMADLKAQGLNDQELKAELDYEARMYGIDTRSADYQDRTGVARDTLDARRAQWMVTNEAAQQRLRLQQRNIDAHVADAALLAATKDPQFWSKGTDKAALIDRYVQDQQRRAGTTGGGSAPASTPAPAAAPAAAPASPSAVPPGFRAAKPDEVEQAKGLIASNKATRDQVIEFMKQNHIIPPPDL